TSATSRAGKHRRTTANTRPSSTSNCVGSSGETGGITEEGAPATCATCRRVATVHSCSTHARMRADALVTTGGEGTRTMEDHERVLIYCRTLLSDDAEDLDDQESQCWEYLAEEHQGEWEVVLTIKEVGNGLSLNRAGLQAILRPL